MRGKQFLSVKVVGLHRESLVQSINRKHLHERLSVCVYGWARIQIIILINHTAGQSDPLG